MEEKKTHLFTMLNTLDFETITKYNNCNIITKNDINLLYHENNISQYIINNCFNNNFDLWKPLYILSKLSKNEYVYYVEYDTINDVQNNDIQHNDVQNNDIIYTVSDQSIMIYLKEDYFELLNLCNENFLNKKMIKSNMIGFKNTPENIDLLNKWIKCSINYIETIDIQFMKNTNYLYTKIEAILCLFIDTGLTNNTFLCNHTELVKNSIKDLYELHKNYNNINININKVGLIKRNLYQGRFGNMFIQYCAAKHLARKLNYEFNLPQLQIDNDILPLLYSNNYSTNDNTIFNCEGIHDIILPDDLSKKYNILMFGYFQHINYIDKEDLEDISSALIKLSIDKNINYKKNKIVIHIRCGDQWQYNKDPKFPPHILQPILPISYYKTILNDYNIDDNIIFITESLNDPYIKELQKHFTNATFQSESLLIDFMTMITADVFIMSISTLAWCAMLLNKTAKIYFPLGGFWKIENSINPNNTNPNCLINRENILYYSFDYGTWYGNNDDYNNMINTQYINFKLIGNYYDIFVKKNNLFNNMQNKKSILRKYMKK